MPLTLSGRRVGPGSTEHPSLMDIAVALSRMPRFAGHTGPWFSVLDHTMFGREIIRADYGSQPRLERAWMLHDAHEAVTSDVPTDVKGDDLRSTQEEMDRLIFGAFGGGIEPGGDVVKGVDARCLYAEARVLKDAAIGTVGYASDIELLRSRLGKTLGRPPFWKDQHRHPLVRQYVGRMIELM